MSPQIESAKIIPLSPVSWGEGVTRDVALLELTAADGTSGIGSAYAGSDQVRKAWEAYRHRPKSLGEARGEMVPAMSAIDIALWDIKGKAAGEPVSELLGGRRRDRIQAYVTVDVPLEDKPRDAFERVLRAAMGMGFKALKLCITGFGRRDESRTDSEWDLLEERLLAIAREIVGPDITLMLDVFGSDPRWSSGFEWALKTSRVLEDLDYLWFEEPLPPGATEDYVRLSRASGIAISGGEDFVALSEFEDWSVRRAVSILQPDCTRVGGLTPMRAIREAAFQANIDLVPHGWNTAVGFAADLQLQATTPRGKLCMVEFMPTGHLTEPLRYDPFRLDRDGMIAVPTGPGLGIELDQDRVDRRTGVFDCP